MVANGKKYFSLYELLTDVVENAAIYLLKHMGFLYVLEKRRRMKHEILYQLRR